jgi:selenocysteine-specific elongation factor
MKHIILGTAGHVDHGKTALIKALTNVDTDRLKEEKERGITIELGFAPLILEKGQKIGVVDVPGHEKFVKNMVAGAGGIDLVVLVIAADEGIMPQTREHLNICELLGIKHGIVALTKIDMVDDEWIDLVMEDIRGFLSETFLKDSPVIPLSSFTGKGLSDFRSALQEIISSIEERSDSGYLRLPVDRVFTMKGFGTVITGSLVSGRVHTGETVEVMPSRIKAKIRGIQIHNEPAETAEAGNRTAINLQGTDKSVIDRGDIITHPGKFEPSTRLDILLKYIPDARKVLKNRAIVRLHTGTAEIISRIILLDGDEIEPGDTSYAQIVLGHPTIAMSGDRFVIRSYSPVSTIGGGEILDPLAKKLKRNSGSVLKKLEKLYRGSEREKTGIILDRSGLTGISSQQLSIRTGIVLKDQNEILDEMLSRKEALLLDRDERRVVSFSLYEALQKNFMDAAADYHERFPMKEWIPKEELRITLGAFIDSRLFNRAIRDLESSGKIVAEKENLRAVGHSISLKGEQEELKEKILAVYRESQLTPPSTKELLERFSDKKADVRNILALLLGNETLIKVNEEMYFCREYVDKLREDYRDFLKKEGRAEPASFRNLTGLSRKFTIPLMEYFDKTKLTIRVEDYRILREGEKK